VFFVGEVGLQYRILPEGTDVDLSKLLVDVKSALPKGANLKASETKPVAFGLNALHILIVMEDKQGGAELVEQAIGGVSGVQSVEIVEMGLL
jgi:elongation factor 1-beta